MGWVDSGWRNLQGKKFQAEMEAGHSKESTEFILGM